MIRRLHLAASAALLSCALLSPLAPAYGADKPAQQAEAQQASAQTSDVKLTDKDGRILVEVGGKPFTEYRYTKEKGLPWARPYFYPVKAADGVEITSDQSRTNPKEHPHHRSLYVAQGAVNGVDHWAHPNKPEKGQKPEDVRQPEQKHVKFEKVAGDTIVEQLAWEDKEGKPMLAETRTWRFFAYPDGSRGIDQTSVFSAIDGPVTFGETKEGGLAAIRLNKPISDTSVITLAGGTASKERKTEKDVWGKQAAWCDLSGKIDGKWYGAAILDHPSNPRHPSNWHVRHYGLMGANVFGLHDFDKKKYEKGAGDFKVEPGKPVTFKYRYVIHTGDAESAKLDEKFAEFAGKK